MTRPRLGHLVLLFLVLAPAAACAIEYEIEIDIQDEGDLYELWHSEQIAEDTFRALVDLIRRGVDLETADAEELYALPGLTAKDVQAIVTYRQGAGAITDAHSLVAAGLISDDKLHRIAPFLRVRPSAAGPFAATGQIVGRTLWTSADRRVPATELEAKVQTLGNLTVGANAILTRDQLASVKWDPGRAALTAEPPATRLQLAKIYAAWRTPSYEILAGNFRAGFAQRLVFDDTNLVAPNGFYPDEALYRTTDLVRSCIESAGELPASPCPTGAQTYVSPDFRYRDGLFGLAGAARRLDIGDGWLQLCGFLSRAVHSIYQYEIYDRDLCADPSGGIRPKCAAPLVYRTRSDPLAPTSRYSYQTLPAMWAEPLGGGNVSYFFGPRTHVGVTAYAARPSWLVTGVELDFQQWSAWPYGGGYGAVGADAAWGQGNLDTGLEIARSFDGTPTGGGLGVLSRTTWTWPQNELELALRYYDTSFANPYAGSIAEPDLASGQRARDEAGVRVRFAGRVTPRLQINALGDVWMHPSSRRVKTRLEARGDLHFDATTFAGVYGRWQDKGSGPCPDQTPDDNGMVASCSSQKIDVGAVVRLEPVPGLHVAAQAQLRLLGDPRDPTRLRKDVSAWLTLDWWVTHSLRFYARSRYVNQGIDDNSSLEQSLWSYVEGTFGAARDLLVRVRYDNRVFLDDRATTMLRTPNPEHWLRLELEARF
jgi:hypothetical protein